MSKELVISAASHERRVAILEEGQLVEIYIEREKEFALVGSIYKGKVTRVLPGMQSAFVDIGLDGDAFLYVSDVFENLEDYDHVPPSEHVLSSAPIPPLNGTPVELLPGESLARATGHHEESAASEELHPDLPSHEVVEDREMHSSPMEGSYLQPESDQAPVPTDQVHEGEDERQPESNASAPQDFAPQYNPTRNYPPRQGNDRPGQNFGRSGSSDRGNDRGGDRGRGGRWGRRGGGGARRRGGRPQGGPGGRNLPPSKYASPQGGDSPRFDNRRPEHPRSSGPSAPESTEEPFLLPGESLAKYRARPAASTSQSPAAEPEVLDEHAQRTEETQPRAIPSAPGAPLPGPGVPRRFSGGLPRWLLADAGTEPESAAEESASPDAEILSATSSDPGASAAVNAPSSQTSRTDQDLNEDQVAALASGFVEAKHEESQEQAEADAIVGGAEFDEETEEAEESEHGEEEAAEANTIHAAEPSSLSEDEVNEIEAGRAANRAEFEADAAHESAEHAAALGEHLHHDPEHSLEEDHGEELVGESEQGHAEVEDGVISASSLETSLQPPSENVMHMHEEDVILLPGETRAPRSGSSAPREDFPRDSARIGSNPRSRFQRPFRSGSGSRDRGRDNRGGRPERRGGDRGAPRGRFDRRPGSGPRQSRGHHGSHSGPPRRPQLISEMLKAGQDIVIQIAKEPLGKKGARITSHIALPGRFLVYMPTVHHTGVSRKIISADNRARLRRLVSEAGSVYPGGFIVRTAAGGATDEEIRADIEFLGNTWNDIKGKSEERKAPSLLHRDLNLVERILRDYVSDDFGAIWIDSEEEYGKVVDFVSRFQPKLVNKVKLYTKETPIFEEFGIQHELDKALRAKVWLKSGGYIVINHTEALVAIDVNTGKFVGKGSTRLEDTIVKTNIEAVQEIVRQIRLRDLGGIIVVDFIDMEERRNREKVLFALQKALEQDKAPSKALSFNEFGLVCITRKRTKQALERVLCQPCPYCTGSGMVKSIPTLCYEIQAEARKMAAAAEGDNPNLTLRVHPEIAKALKTRESMLIDELEQNSHKHVIIQSDATLHWEQYDIY